MCQHRRICSEQWRIQDFPEGWRQLPKWDYFFNFLPKTAWKWNNLDPGGVPGAPLGSANGEWIKINQSREEFLNTDALVLGNKVYNPYQKVIAILGQTLKPFDEDNFIPAYGFGDAGDDGRGGVFLRGGWLALSRLRGGAAALQRGRQARYSQRTHQLRTHHHPRHAGQHPIIAWSV